jgi:uncharacterized membrane protein (UPF0127 family)
MRLFAALLACILGGAVAAQECRDDAVYIRGDFGQARFTVEVADDESERARGLMFRESMGAAAGMLFVYPRPQTLSFWMRNTLIELDMIFVDATGVIRNIHHRAQPLDETPIVGGSDLTHVLEINGGMADRLGLDVGDVLRHPSFTQAAAWPC